MLKSILSINVYVHYFQYECLHAIQIDIKREIDNLDEWIARLIDKLID